MHPDATVVVPTHNRSAWLAVTLRSVLWQADVELQVVVVDDGSSDDTTAVVRAFADPRIRLLRHDVARGVAASRNHGAAEARGEWLAFVDDDDVWAPEKLARQIDAGVRAGRSWVYTGCVNVDTTLSIAGGRPPLPPEDVHRLIARTNVVPGGGSNVVVRRATFERAGPFDLRLKNTEDWEMWIRLAEQGPPAWVPEPLLGYRVHAENASLDVAAVLAGAAIIEETHGTRVDRAVLHRWIAESCVRTGRRREAVVHLARAAAAGQAMNVLSDVWNIAERRMGRHRGGSGPVVAHQEWLALAQGWLDRLASAGRPA